MEGHPPPSPPPRPGPSYPPWLRPLQTALDLRERETAEVVFERSRTAASELAPNTRRTWKWVLFLEGLAVLVPMLWLAAPRLGLPLPWVAGWSLTTTLLVVAICWWIRWRAMRRNWGRTRLLSEISRSVLSTRDWADEPTRLALEVSPTLLPVLDGIEPPRPGAPPRPFEERVRAYRSQRIEDQADYYATHRADAVRMRKRISRVITRGLDAALFLAVAGLAVALSSSGALWLRLSGTEVLLGLFGAALPLAAIIYQSFGSVLELDRRAGCYRQMAEYLEVAGARLREATSPESALAVVRGVEQALLGEVVAWYYQMDNAETFYRANDDEAEEARTHARANGWAARLMGGVGWSVGFASRVLLGRGIVVAISAVLTTAVIAYRFPEADLQRSMLRLADGRLLSSARPDPWEPDPNRAEQGFILIAHGLRGKATRPSRDGEHWMTAMQEAFESRLADRCPDICLVDWRFAAIPSRFSPDGFASDVGEGTPGAVLKLAGWVQDVARIRPHAQAIGETVGYKLVHAIKEGKLRADRPMHFIGHSAGGFVVSKAALVLYGFGLAPKELRVTLLDTPMPDLGDIGALLEFCEVEYVCTSALAQGVPDAHFHPRYDRVDPDVPEGIDPFIGAHGFAHGWYVRRLKAGPEGEFRSPFGGR